MIKIREFLGLGYYTSELDKFLAEYERNHPELSISQRKEIEKYACIYAQRDNPDLPEPRIKLWEKF